MATQKFWAAVRNVASGGEVYHDCGSGRNCDCDGVDCDECPFDDISRGETLVKAQSLLEKYNELAEPKPNKKPIEGGSEEFWDAIERIADGENIEDCGYIKRRNCFDIRCEECPLPGGSISLDSKISKAKALLERRVVSTKDKSETSSIKSRKELIELMLSRLKQGSKK